MCESTYGRCFDDLSARRMPRATASLSMLKKTPQNKQTPNPPQTLQSEVILCFADLKLHLQSTDYGNFLANEASPLTVSVIDDKLKEKMVVEFRHMRNHAYEPLASFLDFIT